MITSLDSGSEHFLSAIDRVQKRIAGANLQIASGKRVNAASDAPDQISMLLPLKAAQRHNIQIQSNLNLAKAATNGADDALNASIKLMDRALMLAAQAGNPAVDAAGRRIIAQEIQGLEDQMVTNSRTQVQGRFIFSGDNTARIEDPAGGSFAASRTAEEIFDSGDSVFAALDSLRTALVNDDAAELSAAIPSLRAASYHLNLMQGFYGALQNRLENATNFAAAYDIELRTQLSHIEDADIAAAAMEATLATTQLQAAFQMRARLPQSTLFDYLG